MTLEAAVVPAEVISKCRQMLPLIEKTAEKGNQNSLSDAGVALSLISTAAAGAFMNVTINCAGLTNQITAGELMKKSEITYNEIKEKTGSLISGIIERMRNQ